MSILRRILLAGLFFYLPFSAGAWGMLGHRIVGQIAEAYLSPQAKKEIGLILGTESLAMAANWGDFIKSDTAFDYVFSWHFVNCKDGYDYPGLLDYLRTDTVANAYNKLNFMIAELKKKGLPKDKQLFYLRLIIHIVGDIHQPLHTGRAEDEGGNKIKVMWFSDHSNLHSIWDEKLISYQQLSYTEYARAINHSSPTQRRNWQRQPVSEWIFESYQLSRALYAGITEPDQRLSYRYNFDHVADLNGQLLKAGVRLAGLLNAIFAG